MNNWTGDEHRLAELHRFGPSYEEVRDRFVCTRSDLDLSQPHVHFRPHRWSWGSAAVGWALGVAMVCGAEWLHAHGSGWALGFWGALLAMYPLWLVGSVR